MSHKPYMIYTLCSHTELLWHLLLLCPLLASSGLLVSRILQDLYSGFFCALSTLPPGIIMADSLTFKFLVKWHILTPSLTTLFKSALALAPWNSRLPCSTFFHSVYHFLTHCLYLLYLLFIICLLLLGGKLPEERGVFKKLLFPKCLNSAWHTLGSQLLVEWLDFF